MRVGSRSFWGSLDVPRLMPYARWYNIEKVRVRVYVRMWMPCYSPITLQLLNKKTKDYDNYFIRI